MLKKQNNGGRLPMANTREYKSDVFCMLMEDKKNALQVYNALSGKHYTDPEIVEIMTIEKGISLSIRNDASFIVESDITFTEHQSTYNPNMALREMIYFTDTIRKLVASRDLFSKHRILLPSPRFVVFYNGTEPRPEYEVQRLSDSFIHREQEANLELKCEIYNINPGKSAVLLEECLVLREYTAFVSRVRENHNAGMELNQAVEKAIDDCIADHILEDFLIERRDEVRHMVVIDNTWERREQLIREEEREDGRREGRKAGLQEGRKNALKSMVQKKLLKGKSVDQIADECEEEVPVIRELIREIEQNHQ